MKLRLFVALDLPAPAVAALVRFRDTAADPAVWRPVPDESLHVTLAFLGHRPESDAGTVTSLLGDVPAAAPVLELGDALLLPPRRARVLTVALVDATGALGDLQSGLSAALAGAGIYEPEARPFRPHVTVGRLRPGARAPRAVDAAPDRVAFAAARVVLYRSHVGRGGARYEALAARALG